MNKMKKYELKLKYTTLELEALKRLGEVCDSPMTAVWVVAEEEDCTGLFKKLHAKYTTIEHEDEFNFMADINNVVMGTAIFPEEKYVVHDKFTDQYIYYNVTGWSLCWGRFDVTIPDLGIPEKKTKDEWLAINPAYEPMLESVED